MKARIPKFDSDVVIVGGGPVGLLLGVLLGSKGIKTIILERRINFPRRSMAIGVTPPSLDILRSVGLDQEFVEAGIKVRQAEVYEKQRRIGGLSFDDIPSRYRFFLSLPQSITQQIILSAVLDSNHLRYRKGVEFVSLDQSEDSVTVHARDFLECRKLRLTSRFAIGCDGVRSRFRQACGISTLKQKYRQLWIMGDYANRSSLGDKAYLFFGPDGSIESFPLPQGKRRWIAQTTGGRIWEGEAERVLRRRVEAQVGEDLSTPVFGSVTQFGAQRMLADSFHSGRAFLCGDAAHVMSSIGGQGMNTGFAAAQLLAEMIHQSLLHPGSLNDRCRYYEEIRRKAFNVAADRAARGMWLGTLHGEVSSICRRWFIEKILFGPLLRRRLAPYFSMLTIPNRDLAHSHPSPFQDLEPVEQ